MPVRALADKAVSADLDLAIAPRCMNRTVCRAIRRDDRRGARSDFRVELGLKQRAQVRGSPHGQYRIVHRAGPASPGRWRKPASTAHRAARWARSFAATTRTCWFSGAVRVVGEIALRPADCCGRHRKEGAVSVCLHPQKMTSSSRSALWRPSAETRFTPHALAVAAIGCWTSWSVRSCTHRVAFPRLDLVVEALAVGNSPAGIFRRRSSDFSHIRHRHRAAADRRKNVGRGAPDWRSIVIRRAASSPECNRDIAGKENPPRAAFEFCESNRDESPTFRNLSRDWSRLRPEQSYCLSSQFSPTNSGAVLSVSGLAPVSVHQNMPIQVQIC